MAIDGLYPDLVGGDGAGAGGGSKSVFGSVNVVNPHDTRQYLYYLKPNKIAGTAEASGTSSTQTVQPPPPNTIGKLDIVWRTNLGDKGRLQTSQFVRSVSCMGCTVGKPVSRGGVWDFRFLEL